MIALAEQSARRRWTRQVHKYLSVAGMTSRTMTRYLGEQVLRTLFLTVIMFTFTQLWRTTYAALGITDVNGYGLGQMLWYLVLTESIATTLGTVGRKVDEEVRSGDLAYRLNKPVNYALYHYAEELGELAVRWPVHFGVAALTVWASSGTWSLSAWGLLRFIPLLWLAFTLNFLVNLALGLLAFWVEDTAPLILVYSRMTMILGGMMLPLDAFPRWLQGVAQWLPMNFVVYGPARLGIRFDAAYAERVVAGQLVWIAVLAGIVLIIYRKGVRRLHVHGG